MEDLSGKQLGSYRVVEPLGEGGMAAVYKAYQASMERYVALKILPDHFTTKFQFMTRFEQEAKVLAQLQHPHILPVFDYGEDDGHPYIAMPYLQSGDLTDMMEGQPLPPDQTRRIISQIGDALDYAHQHGLVHRDVKPSNVLLDERGNCLLTDFGIAKIVEGDAPADITTTGTFVGTPAYMSPEQGAGKKLDRRSDIYALGIVLYELATGRVPFRAETPMAVVVKHMNDPLPLPHKLNPTLPEAVEQVILKALAKQPEDRYATAGDMVRALRVAIPDTAATQPVSVDEQVTLLSAAEPTVAAAQSQETVKPAVEKKPLPLWVWAVVAGVVLIAAIGAVTFFTSGGTKEDTDADIASAIVDAATPTETLSGVTDQTPPTATVETTEPEAAETVEVTDAPLPTDPTLYDDFDNPAYDGNFNPEKWDNFGTGQIVQENDSLTILREGQPESATGLIALDYRREPIRHPTFFEASFMAEGPQDGHAYLSLYSHLPTEDYTDCVLRLGGEQAMIQCAYFHNGESTFWTEELPVDYGTRHSLRIAVDPATMTFFYYVDGQKEGAYVPPSPEELEAANFQFDIGVWGASTQSVTAYIDEVRVGQIHQVFYDDFNDPAFDGDLNPELWVPTYNFEGTEVVQQDGALRLARFTADASGLRAVQFDDIALEDIAAVEAKIRLDRDVGTSWGDVGIVLGKDGGEWWFGCYIGAAKGNTEASVGCGGSENDDSEGKTVQLNTWHTVRFEINRETMGITYFIDGDRIDEFIPAEPEALKQANFTVDLKVYSEDGGHIIGYFDDVKIGPVEQ